jgi:hypothetical protein
MVQMEPPQPYGAQAATAPELTNLPGTISVTHASLFVIVGAAT